MTDHLCCRSNILMFSVQALLIGVKFDTTGRTLATCAEREPVKVIFALNSLSSTEISTKFQIIEYFLRL